jgi:uncharacterized protein
MPRGVLSALAALLVAFLAATAVARDIPPHPTTGLTLDGESLLSADDAAEIARVQADALAKGKPIAVATIATVRDYGEYSIDALGRRWFDAWRIGTTDVPGGSNAGMLLLVAVRDRRARIELGGDWGADWDAEARHVMDDVILPRFRAGEPSKGVRDGVAAMAKMAAAGPKSRAPSREGPRFLQAFGRYSFFGGGTALALAVLGVAIGAFGVSKSNGWIVVGGVALVAFAMFTFVVLALLFLVGNVRSRRTGGGLFGTSWRRTSGWGSSSSSSSSSWGGRAGGGGGFSGGSSGGGGASGGW